MESDYSPIKEENKERVNAAFSKYYEYLPYQRRRKESILNVLHFRETGTGNTFFYKKTFKEKWESSSRTNQCFYTRSICAAKYGSSVKPLLHPITSVSQTTKEAEKRVRPRQFEYHPSNSSLMAVGTLDGEVVVINHERGNIVSCISPYQNVNSVLGICWLKQQPSKLLVGSDNGSLRLYDINNAHRKGEDENCKSTLIFDDFEQLTSVHVNSTDEKCVTSGYSKKVAIYDISIGKRLHLFTEMHHEPINVAKFANHCPNIFVTSSFDRYVKLWDIRQKPSQPCYSASSSRGNVMVLFSPDDLYLLVSAVDNEVKQLLAVDGRLHMDFGIVSSGSNYNYTRSYYMNGRDYIISGSCEEPIIRICCAETGRRLKDFSLEKHTLEKIFDPITSDSLFPLEFSNGLLDDREAGLGSSIFVQSLRSDPFRHFHMSVLAAYGRPMSKYAIIKVNLLSLSHSAEECEGGLNICPSYGKGG